MSKSKRRLQADAAPAVITPPVVAEAATDVHVPTVPLSATVEETLSSPWPPPVVLDSAIAAELPAPVEVDRPMRISCGKVIARKLGMPPAAAQQLASLLHDTQVIQILRLQLLDSAAAIRAIIGQ